MSDFDFSGILSQVDKMTGAGRGGQDSSPDTVDQSGNDDQIGQFINAYLPAAKRKAQELGVSAVSLLAQAALETGYGKSVIPGSNNLFNIKDFSGSGVSATDNQTGSRDKYRAYESADQSFDDHANLIGRKYKGAMNTGDNVGAFFSALKAGGYAEDKDYVSKGLKTAGTIAARLGNDGRFVAGNQGNFGEYNPSGDAVADFGRSVSNDQMIGDIAQKKADEAPISSSLKRGWHQMTDALGNSIDIAKGNDEGVIKRMEESRDFDKHNPAPSANQQWMKDWKDGNTLGWMTNLSGFVGNNAEQLANSAPSMAGSIPGSIAGATVGTGVLPGVGTIVGGIIGGFLGSVPGSVAIETGSRIAEMMARDGVNPGDPKAVNDWLKANRDNIMKEGSIKGLTTAGFDGLMGGIGTRIIAGPSLRFAEANAKTLAKMGVDASDRAAVKAAMETVAYKQAMSAPAAELKAATGAAGNAMRGVASFAGEMAGEGMGEYYGEKFASGKGDFDEALLESVMAGGTSIATTGAEFASRGMLGDKAGDAQRAHLDELASHQPAQPQPNSPLTNAANAGSPSMAPVNPAYQDNATTAATALIGERDNLRQRLVNLQDQFGRMSQDDPQYREMADRVAGMQQQAQQLNSRIAAETTFAGVNGNAAAQPAGPATPGAAPAPAQSPFGDATLDQQYSDVANFMQTRILDLKKMNPDMAGQAWEVWRNVINNPALPLATRAKALSQGWAMISQMPNAIPQRPGVEAGYTTFGAQGSPQIENKESAPIDSTGKRIPGDLSHALEDQRGRVAQDGYVPEEPIQPHDNSIKVPDGVLAQDGYVSEEPVPETPSGNRKAGQSLEKASFSGEDFSNGEGKESGKLNDGSIAATVASDNAEKGRTDVPGRDDVSGGMVNDTGDRVHQAPGQVSAGLKSDKSVSPEGSAPAAPELGANKPVAQGREWVREVVEALIRRRAAAREVGLDKTLSKVIEQAEQYMGGADVKTAPLKALAQSFKKDSVTYALIRTLIDGIGGETKQEAAKQQAGDRGLSVGGSNWNSADNEPITVRSGVVYVGEYPLSDYNSGDDVTVPDGATPQQIAKAVNDSGQYPGKKVHGVPQEAQAKATPKNSRFVDPERDSLFMAIAKLGGMTKDDVIKGWGNDPKDFPRGRQMGFNLRVLSNKGLSADGMLEALKQYNYFPQDATLSDFEAAFREELGDNLHMTPEGHMFGAERAAEAQYEAAIADREISTGSGVESFSDEDREYFDEVAHDLADFDIPLPEEIVSSTESEVAGLRSLGFTEQEIIDATQQASAGDKEQVEQSPQAGSAGTTTAGAQGDRNDGFTLAREESRAAVAIPDGDGITKEQADKERDAVPFSLATQSQPKPVGVQTGLFTADGRVSADAKPEKSAIAKAADSIDAKIDDVAARLAAKLKAQRSTTNSGIDPELLLLGAELGTLYISKGIVKFAQYGEAIVNKLKSLGIEADEIKPMLKEFYLASQARVDDATFDQMDDARKVRAFDLDKIVPVHEAIAKAEKTTDTNPSEAQKEAENYRKGKFDWNGLTIAVETPKGAERSGKNEDGTEWHVTMPDTYGYFLGTKGADKDHVDVFIGDKPESHRVYIIDQNKVDSQEFDEHKVMIGFNSEQDAVASYLLSFSDTFGHRIFGRVSDALTVEQLKEAMPSLAKKKPFTAPAKVESEPAAAAGSIPMEIKTFKHTQKNTDQFSVQFPARTSTEDYQLLNRTAIKNGGRYSKFKGNGAVPGFLFDSEAKAKAFIADAKVQEIAGKYVKPESVSGAAQAEPQKAAEDAKESGHFHAGMKDFKAGNPRVLPSYFTASDTKNAKDWYRGWDAANLAKPVKLAPGTRINTPDDKKVADRLDAIAEALAHSGKPLVHSAVMSMRSIASELRKPRTVVSVPEVLEQAADRLFRSGFTMQSEVVEGVAGQLRGNVSEKDAGPVEVTSLDQLRTALFAGKKAHYDYAGTDGRTTWVERTETNGWVAAYKDDSSPVTMTTGGSPYAGGFSEQEAIKKVLADADYRFNEWKPLAESAPSPVDQNLAASVKRLTDYGTEKGQIEQAVREYKAGDDSLLKDLERINKPSEQAMAIGDKLRFNGSQETFLGGRVRIMPGEIVTVTARSPDSNKFHISNGWMVETQSVGKGKYWEPVAADKAPHEHYEISPAADEGSYVVRDPRDKSGQGTILAAFSIGASGKPTKIKYYFDFVKESAKAAIDNFADNRKVPLESDTVLYDTGVKESDNEQTGNGGNRQESLAPVSSEIVPGTGRGEQAGSGSGSMRRPDAARNGRAGENLQHDTSGSVDGGENAVLPERPDDVIEIDGEQQSLEAVAERVKNDNPASEPRGAVLSGDNPGNYAITDDDRLGQGTAGERIRNNMAAIRLVLDLENEQRHATPEEQAKLVKYVGWGGLKNVFKPNSDSKQEREALAELKELLTEQQLFWMGQSVLDAHYTSPGIIRSMYKILRHMGVSGGRFLEPTVGSGNFIGLMPEDLRASSKWYASEIDPITSLIAKHAYPDAQVLTGTGFQDAEFAYNRFDVAIGNPPFGDQRITDLNPKRAEISGQKIHNYVISKSGMHLRPGGVMAMVVTSRFLDTSNPEAREFLSKNFRFLAALRLPNNAFKDNAGTEVTTDIIFLQKLRDHQREGSDTWLDTNGHLLNEDGDTVTLNRYFAENPEHMLGKPSMQGSMYGNRAEKGEFTLQPIEGLDAEAKIAELLADQYGLGGLKDIARKRPEDAEAQAADVEMNREDVPIGGFFRDGGRILERLDDDEAGNVRFRELSPETPWTAKMTLGKKRYDRIKGILSLRDEAYNLMYSERTDRPEEELVRLRSELNKHYDDFVNEFGFLNSSENVRLFSDDARIEFGLESNYKKPISKQVAAKTGHAPSPESATKSALLVERVFYPTVEITHADTPRDGYSISLSQRGKLDIDYVAELTGQTRKQVIDDLSSGDAPLIFKHPETGEWMQEDEYLSGNVKAKLREAKAANIEANVKALEAVQPEDVKPADVHAEFGASWIPADIYEDFLKMLGYSNAKVAVLPRSGLVEAQSVGAKVPSEFAADMENPDYQIHSIFSNVANRRPLVAYDGYGEHRKVNQERTDNLKRIGKKMVAIWNDWVKADSARAEHLAKVYNDTMNTTVERKFDGVTHLMTVGTNPTIQLRNSQKNSSWRMIQSLVTLLDHVVGAGKTMALITGIMERKRLGLSRKAMVVVPNHLVGQWSRDWMQLYPGANILSATEKDFSKANRRRLFARIATGNYDAVIVGHSSFGHIPVDKEAEVDFLMAEVKHLEAALDEARRSAAEAGKKDTRTVRAIKNRIAKRLEKIKELQDKPRDNVASFEDMGIDYLTVDESHEFKNLEYSTTLSNIAGMGSPEGSKKAFDLYMKTQLIQQRGGGIAFATGTPLSNSMVEMYTVLRYLNRQALEDRGIAQFDAWAKTFASIESRDEYTAAGKIKARTVMAAFNNLPELLQIYKQVADTITMSDLKRIYADQIRTENALKGTKKREEFPVPKVKDGGRQLDIAAPTDRQIEFMDYLIARADVMDKLKGKAKQEYAVIDNALWLMNDARKMSLDVRTSDPTAPDEPGNKVNRSAKRIKAIYDHWHKDKGTQLVFCDLSTPGKVAVKDAKEFINKALEKLGLDKDRSIQFALEDKTYEDKWLLLADRADQMLSDESLKDNVRERIETFIEGVTDADMGALITADSGFSVYDALKQKLIESGIPEREIAFIHDAGTSEKKRELFDLVNSGKIRVLMGSSQKMGAGTNAQERVVALHHLDAPWRPSDMEQREGRVIRQGNKLYWRDPDGFMVEIYAYSTERTFDAQMWAVLARKAGFLEQFRKGLRTIKEEGSDADGYAEFMAEATGNPIFREKLVLEREIEDLEAEDRSVKMKLSAAKQTVDSAESKREYYNREISELEPKANMPITSVTFDGKTYKNDLVEVTTDELAKYKEEIEKFEQEEKDYTVARADWEAKGKDSDRGRAPKKPVRPDYPDVFSARMRQHSEWAALIGELQLRMSGVTDETGPRQFKLITQSGHEIGLDVKRSWTDTEVVVELDGAGHLMTGSPTGPKVAGILRANYIKAEYQQALGSDRRMLASLETQVKQAEIAINHLKPIDPLKIFALRDRYTAVVSEVETIANQLAADRAGKENRYITKDTMRFPDGIKKPEAPDAAIATNAEPVTVRSMSENGAVPKKDWLSVSVIADEVMQHVKQFATEIPVVILDRPSDIGIESPNDEATMGMLYNGKIHLFREGLADRADVGRTLWHELLHFGLRRFLDEKEYIVKMNGLYVQDAWIRNNANAWMQTAEAKTMGETQSAGYVRARAVDEALANLSETLHIEPNGYKNNTLLAKATRLVSEWVARLADKLGFKEAAQRWRDYAAQGEARKLVVDAFLKLKNGDEPDPNKPRGWDYSDPAFRHASAVKEAINNPKVAMDKARNYLGYLFGQNSAKTFNILHKTVGSQFHKAKIDADFRRVFDRAQQFLDDVARYGAEAADDAPGLLPKMDTFAGALREAKNYTRDKKDAEAIAAPIFEGTLYEDADGNTGKVWTDTELRTQYKLTDRQIDLYRQFRRSVDHSLETLAVAEMNKVAKVNELDQPNREMDMRELADFYSAQFGNKLRDLKDQLEHLKNDATGDNDALWQNAVKLDKGREAYHAALMKKQEDEEFRQKKLMKEIEELQAMWDGIVGKKNTILKLQREGYAPLMRFGKYTLDVVEKTPAHDEKGNEIVDRQTGEIKMDEKRHFFGMFETEMARDEAAKVLADEYPEASVTPGVADEHGWELFGSVSQDSLEMMARLAGKEDETIQKFYKEAVSSRSALKRLIHRQGIAGYSEDVTRTLASFLLSNARATASAKHFGDLMEAAADIPKHKGDVKGEAVKLINYIRNPNEEAGALRGLLFMQFLGGSIAAAAVNLSQTVTTTFPFLHQYGAGVTDLMGAAKLAGKRMGKSETTGDQVLDSALSRAEDEGVVSPHNIHAMMGETSAQGLTRHRGVRLMSHMWGSMFGMTEQFNRETAFIAAFRLAEKLGSDGMREQYRKQAELNKTRGLPAPDYAIFNSPYSFAKNAVNETQFVMSKAARPNWARGTIGATVMTFKQFSIFYIELLKRMPTKERALMLATLAVLAGIGGLPGADDLDDIMDTLGQSIGYDTNSKLWKERMAADVFGKLGGDFVMHGISAFLPIELSTRLGMGNLVPSSGMFKKSNSGNRDREVSELLGAAGGYYKQLSDAWDYTLQGRYGMAASQGFLPKALKDLTKAYDMATNGTYDDTHGRRVTDVTTIDALIKALGFQPTAVSEIQRSKGLGQQDIALVKSVKSAIAEIWAQGIHDNNADKKSSAQQMIKDWNEKNPDNKIEVKRSQVMQRVRQMSKSAAERMVKTAPKEMRGRVAELFDEES